jgi:hypothetical protein
MEVLVRGTGSIVGEGEQLWDAGTVEVPIQFGIGGRPLTASRGTVQERNGGLAS